MIEQVDPETGEIRQVMTEEERFALLSAWQSAQSVVESYKPEIAREQALRKQVMAAFFPSPVEGTNTAPLPEGWKLKGTYKLDRKVDEAALDATKERLREMGVNPDPLVAFKPSVEIKAYRSLIIANPEAAKIFESAIITKPGSPTLELVAPKVKP